MKKLTCLIATAAAASILSGCKSHATDSSLTASGLDPRDFEASVDSAATALYTLRNDAGMEVCITNYGGRIVSLTVPDRDGAMRDVVLGFDSIAAYFPENNPTDFGAAIGRFANRINHGTFNLDGTTVTLPVNNFGHTLHGGPLGWQYKVYEAVEASDSLLQLKMTSPDGDNGFPGEVTAFVTYRLTPGNTLEIGYEATTTAPTIINLTNHSYFNLSGDPSRSVADHLLTIAADSITPVDSTFMTTGAMMAVAGTPMDFRSAHPIGAAIDSVGFEQIRFGNGYDHNYVLTTGGDLTRQAALLASPESGIEMAVYTTEPGLQVYSGNFLDGSVTGKGGVSYNSRAAICLETQHYPDSPNKPQWPSTVLRPGEKYSSTTILKFTNK